MRRPLAAVAKIGERFGGLTRFHGAWFPDLAGARTSIVYSRGLEEDLALLRRATAVASARLHMGMVALSYGVPYVPLLPTPKTRVILASIGWPGPLLRSRAACLRFALAACLTAGAGRWSRVLEQDTLSRLRTSAEGHWNWLRASLAGAGVQPG